MNRMRFLLVGVAVLLGVVAGCTRSTGPDIRVENAWARPASVGMGGKVTSAAYMTLINKGGAADRLVGVMTDVAEAAELHQSVMEGDVMKMVPVQGGIEIPAGGQVELKPGGYHIMLIGVKRDLKPGDRFTLRLRFEKSGERQVDVVVKAQ